MADGTEPLSCRADMFVSGGVGFTNSGGTAEIFYLCPVLLFYRTKIFLFWRKYYETMAT